MFYYITRVMYIPIIVEATAEQVPQQPNDLRFQVTSKKVYYSIWLLTSFSQQNYKSV